MALGGRGALLNRLYASVEALGAVNVELDNTEISRAHARQSVDDARAALRAAEGELTLANLRAASLEAHRAGLVENIDASRVALGTMSTFPSDVLGLIFEAVCPPIMPPVEGSSKDPDRGIDWEAVVRPFRLVAVCRHWRAVGLESGRIWSYIVIPEKATTYSSDERQQSFFRHFDLLLVRSRSAPLDIVLRATVGPVDADSIRRRLHHHNAVFSELFRKLIRRASRIRLLFLHRYGIYSLGSVDGLPDVLVTSISDLLRCPTPLLENISLMTGSFNPTLKSNTERLLDPAIISPTFLPQAPLLSSIQLVDWLVAFPSSHPGLPSLNTYEFRAMSNGLGLSFHHFWDTFAVAVNLHTVKFALWALHALNSDVPRRPDSLPITSLELLGYTPTNGFLNDPPVLLPQLRTLSVAALAIPTLALTHTMVQGLTALTILGEMSADNILRLRQLAALERFTLNGDQEHWDEPRSSDPLFDALCDMEDVMWPRLQFLSVVCRDLEPGLEGGLSRVVSTRARASQSDSVIAGTRPRAIIEVEYDDSIPVWEAMQLRALLGGGCKRVGSSDDEVAT
ncbi:hypothetical protein EXIGLDRAFT_828419 [Exidia glandulosa HHB12029]|uniref:F-box domain-containing protein n=1 Tax=Exidia glandulosa HHB12029 TaxID=1314781 RepID=A0A165QFM6_EXIGL|nr:hypothetical protein EXIGLDRAFT_828419 [Exidia glandulosa HHB12029]